MANPQKENGFTSVANEILEAITHTALSDYQSRIVHLIWRETYGYQRIMTVLRHKYISTMTGIPLNHVHRTLKTLKQKNIIISRKVSPQKLKYGFQKDWEKWLNQPPHRGRFNPHTGVGSTPTQGSVQVRLKKPLNKPIKKEGFSDENIPTKGEQTSPFENPLVNYPKNDDPQHPKRIGPIMDKLLKQKLKEYANQNKKISAT